MMQGFSCSIDSDFFLYDALSPIFFRYDCLKSSWMKKVCEQGHTTLMECCFSLRSATAIILFFLHARQRMVILSFFPM